MAEQVKWAGHPVLRDDLPSSITRPYDAYSFTDVDRRPAFAYSSIKEWEDITYKVVNYTKQYVRSLNDVALAEQEWEFLDKMRVCWRDKGFGSLVLREPIAMKDAEQAAWLRPFLVKKGLAYATWIQQQGASVIRDLYWGATVKLDRGKGAPYWMPRTDIEATYALAKISLQSKNLDEMNSILQAAGHAKLPMCLTSYARIQAGRKPSPRYVMSGGALYEEGERIGPKIRRIQALNFAWNFALVGIANVMKYAMRGTSNRNDGTVTEAVRLCDTYKYCVATDLSSYDETLSYETIDTWRKEVMEPCTKAMIRLGVITPRMALKALEVVDYVQTVQLLSPPTDETEGARISDTYGTNKSGIQVTSQIGTDCNDARNNAKFATLGIVGSSTNSGDDTVIASDDPRFIDAWFNEDFNNHGFVETRAVDTSFLMKRIPQQYAYLGRMLLSSINKEVSHEPRDEFAAASGIAIRHGLLKGHPLQDVFYPALSLAGDRVRYAVSLARSTPVFDLMAVTAANVPKTYPELADDTGDNITAAMDAGILSVQGASKLMDLLKQRVGRKQLTLGEITEEVSGISSEFARRTVARKSYILSKTRRVA